MRGEEAEASALIEAYRTSATIRGEGGALAGAAWAEAVLSNGLGRYPNALATARRGLEWTRHAEFGLSNWLLIEFIEAWAKTGGGKTTDDARRQLREMPRPAERTGSSGLKHASALW